MAIPYVVQCKKAGCPRLFDSGRTVSRINPKPADIDPEGKGIPLTCPYCGTAERYYAHELRGWQLPVEQLPR